MVSEKLTPALDIASATVSAVPFVKPVVTARWVAPLE